MSRTRPMSEWAKSAGGGERARFGVAGQMRGNVVERFLQSKKLRVDAIGRVDRSPERREDRITDAVGPVERMRHAALIARFPRSIGHNHPIRLPRHCDA